MIAPHVVIVGAGFAGVAATRELTKRGARVTLVDRHPYTTFQPLLYQVATGGLNPGDITYSLRSLTARQKHKRARFRRALVTGIDREKRLVEVDDGPAIPYDYVIFTQGVTANFFGIEGAEQYARTLYTRAAALQVRDTIFGALERLAASPQAAERGFTAVVVGAGATGVEMAGTLAEMRAVGIPSAYPELDPERVRVVMVEMGDKVLPPFAPGLRDYARRQLEERGVDVRLDTAISAVHPDSVDFKDGSSMQADLVIWAAGVGAYSAVADWGLPQGKGGRIVVDEHLWVQGEDRLLAAGDAALIESNPLPQLAQPAIQEGTHAAEQIIRKEAGQPLQPFAYHDKGTMATIGRASAVVELTFGLTLKGLIAWVTWVAVHLFALLGGRNRLQSMISLASRYLLWPRDAGIIIGDVRDTPGREALIQGQAAPPEHDD